MIMQRIKDFAKREYSDLIQVNSVGASGGK